MEHKLYRLSLRRGTDQIARISGINIKEERLIGVFLRISTQTASDTLWRAPTKPPHELNWGKLLQARLNM
jgi:hypothetical protein